jgi:hypothetical protein
MPNLPNRIHLIPIAKRCPVLISIRQRQEDRLLSRILSIGPGLLAIPAIRAEKASSSQERRNLSCSVERAGAFDPSLTRLRRVLQG